jgi:tRNA modification GTPase
LRHRAALERCLGALQRGLQAPVVELKAEDLRLAVQALGRITGRVEVDDVLDLIFREFCIGK